MTTKKIRSLSARISRIRQILDQLESNQREAEISEAIKGIRRG